MRKRDVKLYILEIATIIVFFFALFASNIMGRFSIALLSLFLLVGCLHGLKKKEIVSIYTRQVNIVMILFAFFYIGVFYLLGIYFGFSKSRYMFSLWTVCNYMIPIAIIIITTEIIRHKLIVQKAKLNFRGKKIDLSIGLTFVGMVLVDLVTYTGVYSLSTLEDFLTTLGFVLFSSISCNLLFNYLSVRYGYKSVMIYRLITVLFIYVVPFVPSVYIFFRTFLRMIYPYVIYFTIERQFSNSNFEIAAHDKKRSFIETSVVLVLVCIIVGLVSCKFTFGILVVGSKSMTGSIDVGDAVVYTSKDGGIKPSKGDVIIFEKDGAKLVHRVVSVQEYNGRIRYYTKGDANSTMDDGYVTGDNLIGVVNFRVKYVGYPTLWLRQLFNNTKER